MPRARTTGLVAAATALALAAGSHVVTSDPVPVAFEPGPYATTHVHEAEIGTYPKTWDPANYDGVSLSSDAPDLDDLPSIHAVYMHASDRPSVFADYAAGFQNEHARASNFLRDATGMGFRWDKRTAADGRVLDDITVVRSRFSYAQLSGNKQWSNIGQSLQDAGLNDPDKKYFVWLDADSDVCGRGQTKIDQRRAYDNAANTTTYSAAFRIGGDAYAWLGGWCNPVLHELMHNLGALGAHMPHYDGGHCNDDANDVMCNVSRSPGGKLDPTRPRTLDGGMDGAKNDDYLDPAADVADTTGVTLPWWTVNLSRFLCPRSTDLSTPDCSRPNLPFGPEPTASPSPTAQPRGNKK